MNKIDLLNSRKTQLITSSKDLRNSISKLIDENSLVELNTFAFSKNELLEENLDGLGVITGYATINDNPVYLVAQNGKLLNGGLSKASCDKIANCLNKAITTNTPVVYLLNSKGVQVGEDVSVLEGISNVLSLSNQLKETTTQFAVAIGDVLGVNALLASNCDFTFLLDNAYVSYASSQVLSASNDKPLTKEEIGGNKSVNGVSTFNASSLSEIKDKISKIFDILPNYSGILFDTKDDLNRATLSLNEKIDQNDIVNSVFDKDCFIEMFKNYQNDVMVGIGRIGGISVASIIFSGKEDGVELTFENVLKIKNFANFVITNELPIITFVNTKGIKKDYKTSSTPVMVEIMNMLSNLSNTTRISVVYKNAIGLGYSAFASKQFGNEYTFAFAGSKISLFEENEGLSITAGSVDGDLIDKIKEDYYSKQDSFNSAKLGCVDNIIEPQFVRQYLISALQTLIR